MREPKARYARFNFHPELCVGCDACVAACLDEQNDLPITQEPLRRVYRNEQMRGGKVRFSWYSVACLHCDDHSCMNVCPKGCFSLEPVTGTVQLDNAQCIGCGLCAKSCPYDGIVFHDQKATKCDGCLERLRLGMNPRCVDACPRNAITIDDRPAIRADCQRELAHALSTKKLHV
jgi:Fe-S-cluster-containing dehydrogenase component